MSSFAGENAGLPVGCWARVTAGNRLNASAPSAHIAMEILNFMAKLYQTI